jgi:SAM-dependent methyltransferase
VAGAAVPVQRAGLDGQALPLGDDSVDAALSTFTLCTIPDVAAALAQVRRVLRPGGALHFVEHGRAPDERVRRWQRRLEPVQRRVAGGCHLTRPVDEQLLRAGFTVERLHRYDLPGQPRAFAHLYEGVALP